jgi:dipeptidyl aminopeptidase/acylaminoacyl peptidase
MDSDGSGAHYVEKISWTDVGRMPCIPPYAWSPDGSMVGVADPPRGDRWVHAADGTPATANLTVCEPQASPANLTVTQPDGSQAIIDSAHAAEWSPDGARLAYASGDSLFVADSSSGLAAQVSRLEVPETSRVVQISWSPRRDAIAFSEGTYGDETIYIVDLASGKKRELAKGGAPSWSPDGSRILFTR